MWRAVHIKIYNAFLLWDYAFVSSVCLNETTEDQPPEKAVARSTDETPAKIVTLLTIAWKELARYKPARQNGRTLLQTRRREASACHPRMQPTNCSATALTWTDNCIAPWTNWSACRGGAEEKTCRLFSALAWEVGDDLFAKQSQEVLCFQCLVVG